VGHVVDREGMRIAYKFTEGKRDG